MEFRLTAEQRRFLESGGAVLRGGRNVGRTYAAQQAIIAQAANEEEARLCLEDLHRTGFALQTSDGRRVDPKPRSTARFRYIRFDEGKR